MDCRTRIVRGGPSLHMRKRRSEHLVARWVAKIKWTQHFVVFFYVAEPPLGLILLPPQKLVTTMDRSTNARRNAVNSSTRSQCIYAHTYNWCLLNRNSLSALLTPLLDTITRPACARAIATAESGVPARSEPCPRPTVITHSQSPLSSRSSTLFRPLTQHA